MYPVKKKNRHDFYKALQTTGVQAENIEELLALGLVFPLHEIGPVLSYIDQVGTKLVNIHAQLDAHYKANPPSAQGDVP